MAKVEPDEPYFALLGRDPDAGNLVRTWASRRHAEGVDGEIIMEALNIASAMDAFQMQYNKRVKPPVIDSGSE